ncbi:MAG: hypothetical protein JRG87_00990, partial [Deltaproteobacteria bacterium]|nr:hypothetical protein [Deltaproteobacteria bacterium]
ILSRIKLSLLILFGFVILRHTVLFYANVFVTIHSHKCPFEVLKPLKDDRNFFPPYHAAPVIREEILKTHPKLGDVLSLFGGLIDDPTMQRLNFEVDGEKRRTAEVVEEFLKEKGIL